MAEPEMSVSRRSILAAVPAAMTGAIAPTAAASAVTDPHLAWLARWRAVGEVIDAHPTGEGPDVDRAFEERRAIEKLISETKAETLAGIRAQIDWLVEDGETYWGCEDHRAAATSIASALRELKA